MAVSTVELYGANVSTVELYGANVSTVELYHKDVSTFGCFNCRTVEFNIWSSGCSKVELAPTRLSELAALHTNASPPG